MTAQGCHLIGLTQWLGTIFFALWLSGFWLLVGRIYERWVVDREVQRRALSMLRMRHIAPGPAVVPQLVDPRYGIIERRWGAEEELI